MVRKACCAVALVVSLLAARDALGARSIQGTVGQVTQTDGAALGPVGFRIWSALPGGETNINDNVSSCRNVRCVRSYITNSTLNPGGYVGNMEATQIYNGDLPDQPYYQLVDASMNDDAGNHIGYFGVSGVNGNNQGIGSFLAAGCSGATATNCFIREDSSLAAPPLSGTYAGYGGSNSIRAIGGLNPIPNVRLDLISQAVAYLSWIDPPTYAAAMRGSTTAPAPPPSPVLGVRLWQNVRIGNCNSPGGNDPEWAPLSTFDLGQNNTTVALNPGADCTFFALTVRLVGPGGSPNEVETFRVGVSSFPAITECIDFRPCADDFVTCTDDYCLDGACQHLANGSAPCDDGNLCTTNDHCSSGACFGTPANCNDTNVCTSDTCTQATGLCAHANISGPCDDGNACTAGDTCSNGLCAAGGPLTCNDGNLCTTDTCQALAGCVFTSNTLACNDANPCTVNDQCAAGACGGTAITAPPEITHDRLPSKATLVWDPPPGAPPGTVYDVTRGRANELPPGAGVNESCRASGITQTTLGVPEYPPIGKAFWFLVRARNTCGDGTWGTWSAGIPRFPPACP